MLGGPLAGVVQELGRGVVATGGRCDEQAADLGHGRGGRVGREGGVVVDDDVADDGGSSLGDPGVAGVVGGQPLVRVGGPVQWVAVQPVHVGED